MLDRGRAYGTLLLMQPKEMTVYTAETLLVTPLDMSKLNADVSNGLSEKTGKPNTKYEVRDRWAVVWSVPGFEGVLCSEAVGEFDKAFYTFDVYHADGTDTWVPAAVLRLRREQLEHYALSESVTLRDFMGERYGYNARLTSNVSQWLSAVNGAVKFAPGATAVPAADGPTAPEAERSV